MRGAGSMEVWVSNTMRGAGVVTMWVSNTMKAQGTIHSAVTLVDQNYIKIKILILM